jgi:hypothetical protein
MWMCDGYFGCNTFPLEVRGSSVRTAFAGVQKRGKIVYDREHERETRRHKKEQKIMEGKAEREKIRAEERKKKKKNQCDARCASR